MVRLRSQISGAASLLVVATCVLGAAPAAAAPIKVACVGEHTTHSHAFPADNRESQPVGMQEYPAQLQALLGPAYDVRNFGDCCATVLQGYTVSETHPYINGTNAGDGVGYKESIAFLPDIVIIGSWGRHDWGLNKAPGQVFTLQGFEAGYDDLIKRYQALETHPKIFVSLPIPILNGQGDVPDEGVKTSDVLPSVTKVATKYQLPIIDLYSPFLNHQELFKQPPDPRNEGEGEHVTNEGLTVIAKAIYAAMQKDLQSNSGGGGAGGAAGTAGETAGGGAGAAALGGAGGGAGANVGGGGGTAGAAAGSSGDVNQTGGVSTTAQAGQSPSAAPASSSDGGCGCRLPSHDSQNARVLMSCFLGATLFARRKARRVSR